MSEKYDHDDDVIFERESGTILPPIEIKTRLNELTAENATNFANWQAAAAENRRLAGIEQDRDAYQEKAEIAEGMNVACGLVIKNLKDDITELESRIATLQAQAEKLAAALEKTLDPIKDATEYYKSIMDEPDVAHIALGRIETFNKIRDEVKAALREFKGDKGG